MLFEDKLSTLMRDYCWSKEENRGKFHLTPAENWDAILNLIKETVTRNRAEAVREFGGELLTTFEANFPYQTGKEINDLLQDEIDTALANFELEAKNGKS